MSSRRKLRRVVLRQRRLLSASPGKGPARYAVICSVALGNNVFAYGPGWVNAGGVTSCGSPLLRF